MQDDPIKAALAAAGCTPAEAMKVAAFLRAIDPHAMEHPEDMAAAVERAAQEAPMTADGWRPIETAPRQTEVLVCRAGMRGLWAVACRSALGEWWDASGMICTPFEPTHWQPLSAPPKDAADA